jgi:hypothetical protein
MFSVFIVVYNKCVILLSKWATLNAASCITTFTYVQDRIVLLIYHLKIIVIAL